MTQSAKKENEIATNKLLVDALNLKTISGILTWILAKFFSVNPPLLVVFKYYLFPFYIVVSLTVIYVIFKKFDGPAISYVLFAELIIGVSLSFFVFGIFVSLFIILPTIISARALDKKQTITVSLITWLGFMIAVVFNVYCHWNIKLFYELHMYQGELIWDSPRDCFFYVVIPTTSVFIIANIITNSIIVNGRKQLKKELEQASKIAVLNSELNTAAQIQQNALPHNFFETKDCKISINAKVITAKEVGGDFYDYLMLDNNKLAFLVADVSDKGLSAAMFMMAAQRTIRIALQSNSSLEEAVNIANKLICQNNDINMFLTVWIGLVSLNDMTMQYINCGHPSPYLLGSQNKVRTIEDNPNVFLGCFENAVYKSHTIKLSANNKLVLFTDGLTDIRNASDEMFGSQRLAQAIQNGITNPSKLIDTCLDFADGQAQFDDMTAMEIHFN